MGWKTKGVPTSDICVGDIKATVAPIAPNGWLICDGSAVNRVTYANLFSIIGTNYGIGDGTTTFNLPDFRGKVGVGLDAAQTEFASLGKTGGEKTHAITTNEMPAHNHGTGTRGASDYLNSNINNLLCTGGSSNYQGSNQAHNNLQPYITVNYIIKF